VREREIEKKGGCVILTKKDKCMHADWIEIESKIAASITFSGNAILVCLSFFRCEKRQIMEFGFCCSFPFIPPKVQSNGANERTSLGCKKRMAG